MVMIMAIEYWKSIMYRGYDIEYFKPEKNYNGMSTARIHTSVSKCIEIHGQTPAIVLDRAKRRIDDWKISGKK